MLFQELFYGPYFCQVQDAKYYAYTELIPDGPTTKRMQDLAKQTGMVLVVPMYEEDAQASGIYYNTAAVIDADGQYLGKYRKTHIPHVKGFWEKFYFRPGNMGYPVFETAVGKVGVYICYDRHFPEGARALGLNGAEMVFIPSATSRGLSEYLWRIEQVSARGRERLLRRHDQPGRHRAGGRRRRLLRPELLRRPARPVHRRGRLAVQRGADRPRHGPRQGPGGPPDLAVLPGPPPRRVRRPRPALAALSVRRAMRELDGIRILGPGRWRACGEGPGSSGSRDRLRGPTPTTAGDSARWSLKARTTPRSGPTTTRANQR